MSREQPHFVTLTTELARELIAQMQAVLDGDASYFHVTLLTDDGQAISLQLEGPEDE